MKYFYALFLFAVTTFLVYVYGFFFRRSLIFSFRAAQYAAVALPFLLLGILGTSAMAIGQAALVFVVSMWCLFDEKKPRDSVNTIVNIAGILSLIGAGSMLMSARGAATVSTGAVGFARDLLFFLPCVFSETIMYLKGELDPSKITNSTWTMMKVEAILLLLYFGIPWMTRKLAPYQGDPLFEGPAFLNKETKVRLPMNASFPCTLSFWVLIGQPVDSTNRSLCRMGKNAVFEITHETKTDTLVFRFNEKKQTIPLPAKQKWIHVKLNMTNVLVIVSFDDEEVLKCQGTLTKLEELSFGGNEMHGSVMNVRILQNN